MDRDAFVRLTEAGPLLGDGGTGTALVARGAQADACFDALCVSSRDLIREVHADFVNAGACLVETNTFGANRYKLAAHGYESRVHEINVAGAARAREAGAQIVAGSVGPLGVRLAPYGRVSAADARAAFAEQVTALAAGGVDVLLLETHSDLAELEQAVLAARESCTLPIIATVTFTRDDRTLLGETAAQAARTLAGLGVDAMGVNCSEGPEQVLRLIEAMKAEAGGIPLVAQPNAGAPLRVGGRIMFSASPEYFGDYASAFRAAGVWLIGGCCGTQPNHIRAMASALAAPATRVRVGAGADEVESIEVGMPSLPVAPTTLAQAFASGKTVIAVEMDPPRGISAARLVAGADTVRAAGADVVNVADMPTARMRMSAWAACYLVQQEAGIETVLHFPTRGRNLLRVQGDLLAAYALGIRNLFAVLGDSTSIGDFPEAADLADVTPSGLIALVKGSLNAGTDRSGASIGESTSFMVACALNLNATDPEREARVLKRKIDAGADYAITQPIFEADRLPRFRALYEASYGPLSLPILVGLLPLMTPRHAEFLHNEVPGIDIPEQVRKRMAAAKNERAEGVAIALELAEAVSGQAAGHYLIPPFRRYDLAAELIEQVRSGG